MKAMGRRAPGTSRATSNVRRALVVFTASLLLALASAAPVEANIDQTKPDARATPSPDLFTVCPHLTDSIIRLYAAYFDRGPDDPGFAYWVDQLSTGTSSLGSISDFFARSPEFVATYGTRTSTTEFVELVYQNVLGRQPDAEGLAFWTERLQRGELTRGTVMLNFSESPEFIELTDTADPLAGYFDWYPQGTRFLCGSSSFVISDLGADIAEIDILSFVDPRTQTRAPQQVELVLSDQNDAAVTLLDETVAVDVLVLRNISVPPATSGIRFSQLEVRAEPNVFSYVVVTPAEKSNLETRGGWRPGERLPTLRELTEEVDDAVAVVDAYWATHAPDLLGDYAPPTVTGMYDGYRPDEAPICGSTTLGPNNAFFCGRNNSVAWDLSLMAQGYALGDAFVYFVVAHEWAHSIQYQLDAPYLDVAAELQADCLAGATLYGAAGEEGRPARSPNASDPADPLDLITADDDNRVAFEPGDVEELEATLAVLADDEPWADPSSHGNAEERITAFSTGAAGGYDACLASSGTGN